MEGNWPVSMARKTCGCQLEVVVDGGRAVSHVLSVVVTLLFGLFRAC